MAAYESILNQIQLPNLGAVDFSSASRAFMQGRELAQQNAQFAMQEQRIKEQEKARLAWEKEQIKAKQEEERLKKEAAERAIKEQVARQELGVRLNSAQEATRLYKAGHLGYEDMQKAQMASRDAYMKTTSKLGIQPVGDLEFPDLGQAEPGVTLPLGTRGESDFAQNLGIIPPPTDMREQIGALARPSLGQYADNERKPDDQDKLAASLVAEASGIPEQWDERQAKMSPLWGAMYKKAGDMMLEMEANKAAARGPSAVVNNQYNPTSGFATDTQKEIKAGLDQEQRIVNSISAIGAKYDYKTGRIEGGEFDKLFGLLPQGQRWVYDKKSAAKGILPKWFTDFSPEQRQLYDRLLAVRKDIGAINLEEFHRLFGSAQTTGELERSIGRIVDENASPEDVKASLESLMNTIRNGREVRLKLLAEGSFDASQVGTQAWNKKFDSYMIERGAFASPEEEEDLTAGAPE